MTLKEVVIVVRKRNKEQEFIAKCNKIIKLICMFTFLIFTLIYCIKGGFYSLLFDLKESKPVIVYAIIIIVLLITLILLNLDDEENMPESKRNLSSYVTVGIIVLAIFFSILLVFTLIDFFLPIIVLLIILVVAYFLVNKLISALVNKYGIK